ncbi:hypothetical protein EU537_02050 [Candidatus Thorarchaeota archaeon]|nr:MAG: hypothetical protein EU537_02050 [Candidatus Thorarchaeota archaeon]
MQFFPDDSLKEQDSLEYRSEEKLDENERELIDLFSSLDERFEPMVVLVEGKRDEQVLRDLGVKAPIIRTQSWRSRVQLFRHIERMVENKRGVVILTDFDREGKEIKKEIAKELQILKIPLLTQARREIGKAMGNYRCIEELVALFKKKDSPVPASDL